MYNTNDKKSTQTSKKIHKQQKKYTNNENKYTNDNGKYTKNKNTKNRGKYRVEKLKISMFFLRVFVAKKLWEIMALLCHVTEKSLPD